MEEEDMSKIPLRCENNSSEINSLHKLDNNNASWAKKLIPPGSVLGSTLELVNSTIGTGVLALPYALGQSGLTFGLAQLLICAALGYYSARILIRSCEISNKYSYMEIAELTHGSYFRLFVKLLNFVNGWGVCVIYTLAATNFIGAALSIFFPHGELPSYLTNEHSLIWPPIFTLLIVFPLSLKKHLAGLRYVSSVAFLFIFYMTGVVIFESLRVSDFSENIKEVKQFDITGIVTTFPTAIFSFSCHMNIPDVHGELQPALKKKMPLVMLYVIVVASIVYMLISSFGYIAFADNLFQLNCPQNILLSFGYKGYTFIETATILLIAFYIMIALPLNVKPAKEAFKDLIEHAKMQNPEGQAIPEKKQKDSKLKHFLLVAFVVFTQMLTAMFVPSMASMIKLIGASTYGILTLNIPCIFYLKLDKSPRCSVKKIFCYFVFTLASGLCIYSTYDFFADDPDYCTP